MASYSANVYSVDFSTFFFFSSRRRHTRYIGDWSSDVCSSDLGIALPGEPDEATIDLLERIPHFARALRTARGRSEERRVGKECRSRWVPGRQKKRTVTVAAAGESSDGCRASDCTWWWILVPHA